MVNSSTSRGQSLSQDAARLIWLPLIAKNKNCFQCNIEVKEFAVSGPSQASPQRPDPGNRSYTDNCVVFCMGCQHFNNQTPDNEVSALLSCHLPLSDPAIRIPTTWTPDQDVPKVTNPIPDAAPVDPAFLLWLDTHVGKDGKGGQWRSSETNPNRTNHRPVTVTREQVIQLWRQNGGDWCRFFGIKGSWVPKDSLLLTIDKIDPTMGYEEGNLMIMLVRANNAKWHYLPEHYRTLLIWRDLLLAKYPR